MNADTKAAERAVEKFHTQFNQEKYHDIYAEASEDFQKATNEQELTDLLDAVHRKLGAFKSSNPTAWQVNYTPSGTIVALGFETTFEEGKGTEQFTFVMNGNQVKLYSYHINSATLVIK